jgi:hypothetical protein
VNRGAQGPAPLHLHLESPGVTTRIGASAFPCPAGPRHVSRQPRFFGVRRRIRRSPCAPLSVPRGGGGGKTRTCAMHALWAVRGELGTAAGSISMHSDPTPCACVLHRAACPLHSLVHVLRAARPVSSGQVRQVGRCCPRFVPTCSSWGLVCITGSQDVGDRWRRGRPLPTETSPRTPGTAAGRGPRTAPEIAQDPGLHSDPRDKCPRDRERRLSRRWQLQSSPGPAGASGQRPKAPRKKETTDGTGQLTADGSSGNEPAEPPHGVRGGATACIRRFFIFRR